METIHVSFDNPNTAQLVQEALVAADNTLLAEQADAAAGRAAGELSSFCKDSTDCATFRSPAGPSMSEKFHSPVQSSCLSSSFLHNDEQQQQQDQSSPALRNTEKGDTESSSPKVVEGEVNSNEAPFAMGDHVYQWCWLGPIPAVFQHHAIVLDAWPCCRHEDDDQETTTWTLKIADFSAGNNNDHADATTTSNNSSKSKKSLSSKKKNRGLRVYESEASEWNKVVYGARGFWKRHCARSGTATAAQSDAPGLVRARLQFLLDHPHQLPDYHLVQSNCECVAVWCKTGTFGTTQAASWLSLTAAGQAKSAVTVAGVAASTQVTVPAAGLWGWLGYTTHASLLATQPYLLPAIAAYGIVTVGAPTVLLLRSKQQWKERTVALNEAFWESAVEHPDVFVECITHWSSQHEPPL